MLPTFSPPLPSDCHLVAVLKPEERGRARGTLENLSSLCVPDLLRADEWSEHCPCKDVPYPVQVDPLVPETNDWSFVFCSVALVLLVILVWFLCFVGSVLFSWLCWFFCFGSVGSVGFVLLFCWLCFVISGSLVFVLGSFGFVLSFFGFV